MSIKTVTAPSGLQLEIRNLKAREMSILAATKTPPHRSNKAKRVKQPHPLDPIYEGCTLNIIDPGPYTLNATGKLVWSEVLSGDRFYLLLQIRDCTWGSYEFKVRCVNEDCPRHKKPFIWDLDLNGLEVKDVPEATLEKVRQRDLTFETVLAGRRVKYKILTGEDEANQPTLGDHVPEEKKLLAQVAGRVFWVEGIESDAARIEWVGDLDLPDIYSIQRELEAVDGGVETRTIVECSDCGEEFTTDVPFADTAFLSPTRK